MSDISWNRPASAEDIEDQTTRLGFPGVVGLFRRNAVVILPVLLAALGLSWLAVETMTPVYTARTALVVEPAQTSFDTQSARLNARQITRSEVYSEMELLSSREFASDVVGDLNLTSDPDFNPHLQAGAAPARSDAETLDSTTTTLLSRYTVSFRPQSLAVEINVRDQDPRRAAVVANGIAESYILRTLSLQHAVADRSIDALRAQIDGLNNILDQREDETAAYINRHGLEDKNLRSRLSDRVQLLQGQLSAARQSGAGVADLEARLAETESELRDATYAVLQARTMERNLEMTRERLSLYNDRLNNLYFQRELVQPTARQLGRAVVPFDPTLPKKNTALAGAFVGGLCLAMIAALLRESMRSSIRRSAEAEAISGLHRLGRMPRLRRRDRKTLTAIARRLHRRGPDATEAETIHMLLTTLAATCPREGCLSLAILSPSPDEGRSILAASLAIAAAQERQRVLLVDLSPSSRKRGLLHSSKAASPDLVALMSDPELALQSIQPVIDGLDLDLIQPSGGALAPLDLTDTTLQLPGLNALRQRYDLILFDTPPLLGSAVASRAPLLADCTILLVRRNRTERQQFRSACDLLRISGSRPCGIVINEG